MLESIPSVGNSLSSQSALISPFSPHPSFTQRRYLRKRNLEPLLNLLQNCLIVLAADKRNTQSFGAETACTTYAVQVRVGVTGEIVVDGEVDTLNVDAATEDVGGNADALVEFFEFFVALDAGEEEVLVC